MLGLIGTKVGMTQIFSQDGEIIPVTVVKVDKNVIVNLKTEERDGYKSIVVGYDELKPHKVNKVYGGIFKNDVKPQRYLKEFRVDSVDGFEVGQEIGIDHFEGVDFIDVIGLSKGKGFQGVMKRHNFGGGRKTHGSKFHRQNGSTGQCSYPSRVFKGLKRAGRMGYDRVTVQNLKLVEIDKEKGFALIKGAIPGPNKSLVYINKAIKKIKK